MGLHLRGNAGGMFCAVLLASLLSASSVLAQTRTLAEIATYQGPDRTARLIEGAKKEGVISFYSTTVPEDTAPVIDAFKKKYGIDVQVWRGSTEAIVQRAVNEARAGRCPADLYYAGTPASEPLRRENMLVPILSLASADLMPQAHGPDGAYVGVTVNVFAAAYNTNLVKPAEVPGSYDDLKQPRWKGRLAVEADDMPWFAALASAMGEDKALPLFRDIVRTNGLTLRKGHTFLTNMVAAGEVPFALTVFSYKSDQLARAGGPIRTLYLPPVIALATGVSVGRCAPHPNAAVLFYDFMLGDAQAIFAKRNLIPTNRKIGPLPAGVELVFMHPGQMLDEEKKWSELWDKIVVRPQ